MEKEQECKLSNPSNNLLISDILKSVAEMVQASFKNAPMNIEKKSVAGTKGEIITTLVIGLATSIIYDLLKTAVKRFTNRQDFQPKLNLQIENNIILIENLLDKD